MELQKPISQTGDTRAMRAAIEAVGVHIWSGGEFCHYTDLSGLVGIVENSGIWLSDHRFLNDSLEHSYGQRLAINLVESWIEREEEGAFRSVLCNVKERISGDPDAFYIASMSLTKDRLDQWKAYGRGADGVCLVFENDVTLGRDGVLTRLPSIEPMKVIYQRDDQKAILERVMATYKAEMLREPCKISDGFSLWQKSLAFLLALQFIRFKHPEYASEEEVRIVASSISPMLDGPPLHRVSGGRIIPYYVTNRPRSTVCQLLPLKEVIVGPVATQDSIVKSVEVFLANSGYVETVVRKSLVPFRG